MKCDTIPDLERFLSIQEQALGANSPEVASTVSKLATLYLDKGFFNDAETLYRRALAIQEKALGPYRLEVEETRTQLAKLVCARDGAATSDCVTAVPATSAFVSSSTSASNSVNSELTGGFDTTSTTFMGWTHVVGEDQVKDVQIELATLRHAMGKDHPQIADCLTKLADALCRRKHYDQMEPALLEALAIRENALGDEHPLVSTSLKNLARLYYFQGRYELSEPLFKKALNIRQKIYGKSHSRYADVEEQYAKLLRKTERVMLAQELENHVKSIRSHF
jgi:tetratricopeptide (TPR) repeat protein